MVPLIANSDTDRESACSGLLSWCARGPFHRHKETAAAGSFEQLCMSAYINKNHICFRNLVDQ